MSAFHDFFAKLRRALGLGAPAATEHISAEVPATPDEPALSEPETAPETTGVATRVAVETRHEPSPDEETTAEAESDEENEGGPIAVAAPSAAGLVLRLESERGVPATFEVTRSGATIGRGQESTIRLEDLSVSRRHARIAYRGGAYWISDLGSMGGTWVDGKKLAAARPLATGQVIDIGVCRLSVAFAADAPKPRAETGAARKR